MSTEMLEYIRDDSKSHSRVNWREAHYKIRYHIIQSQTEWKGELLSMQNMGKVLHKVFKTFVNEIFNFYQFWVNLVQEFPILFHSREFF